MSYSEEEIKKYLELLLNYTNNSIEIVKSKCTNCENREPFSIDHGYKVCEDCGVANGHVLRIYDFKDCDRLYYRKKSIYQRKYYYEKKVNQVSKRINLSDEEKNKLYSELLTIDNDVMEILNEQYNRKRMISIFYLIKKLLEDMGCEKYKLVYLKISPRTLENYENWWDSYKSLKTG